MKIALNIFGIIALLCLFPTYGRNVKCPDLDKNVLSWFPYEEGSVIRLENEVTNTSLMFQLTK
ncbi:MAG: hypothetical protein LBR52_02230 [Prevotellaceae bacterium]|jgi:hypothetical protein|nr:hypothetical protein [Prevotellaceae bacterium]